MEESNKLIELKTLCKKLEDDVEFLEKTAYDGLNDLRELYGWGRGSRITKNTDEETVDAWKDYQQSLTDLKSSRQELRKVQQEARRRERRKQQATLKRQAASTGKIRKMKRLYGKYDSMDTEILQKIWDRREQKLLSDNAASIVRHILRERLGLNTLSSVSRKFNSGTGL